jgi:hypothetical protein
MMAASNVRSQKAGPANAQGKQLFFRQLLPHRMQIYLFRLISVRFGGTEPHVALLWQMVTACAWILRCSPTVYDIGTTLAGAWVMKGLNPGTEYSILRLANASQTEQWNKELQNDWSRILFSLGITTTYIF